MYFKIKRVELLDFLFDKHTILLSDKFSQSDQNVSKIMNFVLVSSKLNENDLFEGTIEYNLCEYEHSGNQQKRRWIDIVAENPIELLTKAFVHKWIED